MARMMTSCRGLMRPKSEYVEVSSEGGKHIFKNLVSCRMEIQQHLKAIWKNLENITTIDEEMKDLSAKAAKASRKEKM